MNNPNNKGVNLDKMSGDELFAYLKENAHKLK
jgi:hypothetical protein